MPAARQHDQRQHQHRGDESVLARCEEEIGDQRRVDPVGANDPQHMRGDHGHDADEITKKRARTRGVARAPCMKHTAADAGDGTDVHRERQPFFRDRPIDGERRDAQHRQRSQEGQNRQLEVVAQPVMDGAQVHEIIMAPSLSGEQTSFPVVS